MRTQNLTNCRKQTGKVLLLQQDGTYEWISNANLDRLGSIPSFRHHESSVHFFKANKDACLKLLGVHVVMAIQGVYDPISPNKWVLLAGGQELRWCKICQAPRTLTPRQCNDLLEQQCHITLRNLVECREDQPMMLINGDVLWSDTRVRNVVPLSFGCLLINPVAMFEMTPWEHDFSSSIWNQARWHWMRWSIILMCCKCSCRPFAGAHQHCGSTMSRSSGSLLTRQISSCATNTL